MSPSPSSPSTPRPEISPGTATAAAHSPSNGSHRLGSALRAARSLLPGSADYRDLRRTWKGDLIGGVTVGIVALPLALGFGVSSGLTAEQGLVTAIVAGMLAAVFGGSNVQVSGPTGAMVVVLLPIVATQGAGAVAAVTLLAGVIVVLAGALRLGRVVGVIPWPVIEGFTLGIACIIGMQQLPLITSAHQAEPGELSSNAIVAAVQSLLAMDPAHFVWGLGAVAIVVACMIISPRIHRSIPGSLVGIAVVTALAAVLPTPLARIGTIPSALPAPSLPTLDLGAMGTLLPAAATVAALAAIESLLSARVAAGLADTGVYDPDRELVGQGVASIGASLFGGMPATGAIARTSVNVRAGGRTRLASVIHALVLLAVVYAASGPVGMIPLAALAGVLIMTAVRMVHLATARTLLRSTKADAATFALTALITVSFDLIAAVLIGVTLAAIFSLRTVSRSSGVALEPVRTADPEPGDEEIIAVRFTGQLFFISADRVFDTVMSVGPVTVVILRVSMLELVDATGARVLENIVRGLEGRGITVLLKGMRQGHTELFDTVGVLRALRHHKHVFADFDGTLEHARSHVRRAHAARADTPVEATAKD
ncbi:SulP family inorganic anion transporter [Brachybacterium alimentarium]|uniref:SulP family inorganic anion transporter n=1 Tax=Brachybacterium alimentarium TaxID=47845 RepID=UPI000DF12C37|nr:SulP family inorganic anion transporter [Brachybacterium alimentarium]RCS81654.1 SulP family inorganic anion transporter [Brachybacterium alimentarium]